MLMNLDYTGTAIRVAGTSDHPEWVAADVCKVLGMEDAKGQLKRFKQTEKGVANCPTPGGVQKMLTVTEPGLYRLLFKCRKPEAERFQTWVFHEVLPCIRKHGCYPAPTVEVGSNALVQVSTEEFFVQLGKAVSKAVTEATTQAIKPLCEQVGEMSHRISLIEKRTHLTVKTKQRHRHIVKVYYLGQCPCCRMVRIVNDHGDGLKPLQYDHWVRPSEATAEKTWAVCVACNLSLRSGDWKQEKEVQFKAYQECRRNCDRVISGKPSSIKFLTGMEDLH